MGRVILRRLLTLVPTVLIVTFGVFLLVTLTPHDPATTAAGGLTATPQAVRAATKQFHLDDPLLSRYGRWLSGAAHGDLGISYITKKSVSSELANRIPVTFGLILAATLFALLLSIPLGILSGLRPNGGVDQGSRAFASLAIAVPNFVLALVLVLVFAVRLGWLPPSGYRKFGESPLDWLKFIALPAIALGAAISAAIMRQLRAALVDELDTNHIRTQWAIGGRRRGVVGRHGLKNASSPAITILGLQAAALVGGTVLVEQIFALPGMGTYMLGAIVQGDVPVVQGCVLVLALVQIAMSLAVDVTYAFVNPKVRVTA